MVNSHVKREEGVGYTLKCPFCSEVRATLTGRGRAAVDELLMHLGEVHNVAFMKAPSSQSSASSNRSVLHKKPVKKKSQPKPMSSVARAIMPQIISSSPLKSSATASQLDILSEVAAHEMSIIVQEEEKQNSQTNLNAIQLSERKGQGNNEDTVGNVICENYENVTEKNVQVEKVIPEGYQEVIIGKSQILCFLIQPVSAVKYMFSHCVL